VEAGQRWGGVEMKQVYYVDVSLMNVGPTVSYEFASKKDVKSFVKTWPPGFSLTVRSKHTEPKKESNEH
jgi:hypothetical protein